MNKKAQGISINTIIVAAIALIVLVVLVAIFTGRLGSFTGGVQSCTDKGGTCKPIKDNNLYETCRPNAPLRGTDCKTEETCCVPITEPIKTETPPE